MKKLLATLMLLASLGLGLPAVAAEPSLHEVYQTANAGKLDEAQRMMREVLATHPNSGKAHYVEAELLAKQGQHTQAAAELATAERLAPGLPFASSESVASLKRAVDRTPASPATSHTAFPATPVTSGPNIPWGLLLTGIGLIAFIVWAAKFMANRNRQTTAASTARPGFGNAAPASPPVPYAYGNTPGYGVPGSAPAPAAGSGLGSQMLGGLATGVAVGAGVAAGEALMHRVMGDRHSSSGFSDLGPSGFDTSSRGSEMDFGNSADNLGGNDFGITDNASWDDGGASGDSDWN